MQIGIDLGGTKIEGIALDADTLIAVRRRLATPRDYAGTLDAIARLVTEIEAEAGRTICPGRCPRCCPDTSCPTRSRRRSP